MGHDRQALPKIGIGRLLFFAGPLLWAILVVFHPMPEGSPYAGIKDDVDRWLFLHVGQLILTPFLFLAVWRLLDGLSSATALVSRAALVVWTVSFTAYDSIQGVTTGILTHHANGLAGDEQAAFARTIEFIVEDSRLAGNVSALALVAGASWLVVAIAAAVALHKGGAGNAVVAAAGLSSLFAAHVAPAAIGLIALFVAGFLRERRRTKSALGAQAVTEAARGHRPLKGSRPLPSA